jgi:putative glycosyltransferase (TIGR04372 family)
MKNLSKYLFLPFVGFLILLKPLINFRFVSLSSSTLGHFTIDTFIHFLTRNFFFKIGLIRFNIYIIEDSKPCNNFLLKLWKKKLFIIKNNYLIQKYYTLVSYFNLQKFFFKQKMNQLEHSHYLISHPIPFTNKDFEKEKVELIQEKIGLNLKRKWICVHNRDNSFYNFFYKDKKKKQDIEEYNKIHEYRNFKLQEIRGAINLFLKEGYQVVNMSFNNNENLKITNKNFIDYSQSSHKSDFGNFFLLSHCELFFGSDSGVNSIPLLFQKQSAVVNIAEIITQHAVRYWYQMLMLPKIIRNKATNELIPLKDYQKHKLVRNPPFFKYPIHEFKVQNNTEDEILEFAKENIFFLKNGFFNFTNEDKKIQNLYLNLIEKVCPKRNRFDIKKNKLFISPYFLKKNIDLIK